MGIPHEQGPCLKVVADNDLQHFRSKLSGSRQVFLMAGIPFSGKSEWLEDSFLPPNNLYVNSCFDDPHERIAYIDCAKEEGLAVGCVWLNPPLEECVRRSEGANGPERSVLVDMHRRLNTTPPSLDEGFSLIQEIRRCFYGVPWRITKALGFPLMASMSPHKATFQLPL